MSTRATIRIESVSNPTIWVYHHCDGYPEGVGEELKSILPNTGLYADSYDIANALLKYSVNDYSGYELTSGRHTDEEFEYVIDADNRTLECYATPLGEPRRFKCDEARLQFTFDFGRKI